VLRPLLARKSPAAMSAIRPIEGIADTHQACPSDAVDQAASAALGLAMHSIGLQARIRLSKIMGLGIDSIGLDMAAWNFWPTSRCLRR